MLSPNAADRKQFLTLALVALLVNLLFLVTRPQSHGPAEAVPPGELTLEVGTRTGGGWLGRVVEEHGPAAVNKIRLNQSPREDLLHCPGIGSATADRLLTERARHPFRSWDDLQERIKGIGPQRIDEWKSLGVSLGQ